MLESTGREKSCAPPDDSSPPRGGRKSVAREGRREGRADRVDLLVRDTPGITKSNLEIALVTTKLVRPKPARDLIDDLVKLGLIAEARGPHNSLTYQLVSSYILDDELI